MDFQELGWASWTGLIWLRTETIASFCKHGNETSLSIKRRELPLSLKNNLSRRILRHGVSYLGNVEAEKCDREIKEN